MKAVAAAQRMVLVIRNGLILVKLQFVDEANRKDFPPFASDSSYFHLIRPFFCVHRYRIELNGHPFLEIITNQSYSNFV